MTISYISKADGPFETKFHVEPPEAERPKIVQTVQHGHDAH